MIRTLLVAASLLASSVVSAGVEIGKPAPAFTLKDSNNKSVGLADFGGKYVVLEWTNDQCPFVKKHYVSGNMQSLQKELTGKGVVWLTVNSSAPGKQGHVDGAGANELTKSRDASPTAVLMDPKGRVGRLYGAKTTPHMYIVDPKGTLIYMGGIDSIPSADKGDIKAATPYVKVALKEAMAGKPVTNASTKPYGCSVKYD